MWPTASRRAPPCGPPSTAGRRPFSRSRARALPEPSLGFSVFLQAIETRTGPQQGRVSLEQVFPWPTALAAGADAAAARARAADARVTATAEYGYRGPD